MSRATQSVQSINHFFPHLLPLRIVSMFATPAIIPQVTEAGKLRTLLPSYPDESNQY